MDRPRRSEFTARQMDEVAGWWTTNGMIALPHYQGSWEWLDNNYNCIPISLLCHTYTLYERLILNRIDPIVEGHLIKEQAGVRIFQNMLSNRIFYVELNNERSRWGNQKNGLPSSISVHLASSAVTPAVYVHKSRGDNVVRMWLQLKR